MSIRRTLPLVLLLAVLLPARAEAQPSFLAGAGFTSAVGDFADLADPGFHVKLGLSVAIPVAPISLQVDGAVHSLEAADSGLEDVDLLSGAVSVVYDLPGVGLVPYLLAGIGSYRIEAGPVGESVEETDVGYHAGFGVNLGTGSVRGFAEIRYVQVDSDPNNSSFIPLTVGLRF